MTNDANQGGTVNTDSLQADLGTGDILHAMENEQANMASISDKLGSISKTLNNIYDIQREVMDFIKRQTLATEKIFNLLMLWARKGGIADPTRSGMMGLSGGNPIGNNSSYNLINSTSRLTADTNRMITDYNRLLNRSQVQQDTLISRLEQLLVNNRENFSANSTQLIRTQESWDKSMSDFIESLKKNSKFSIDDSAENINNQIQDNLLKAPKSFDDGQTGLMHLITQYTGKAFSDSFNLWMNPKNPITYNPHRVTEFSDEQVEEAKEKAKEKVNQILSEMTDIDRENLRKQYLEAHPVQNQSNDDSVSISPQNNSQNETSNNQQTDNHENQQTDISSTQQNDLQTDNHENQQTNVSDTEVTETVSIPLSEDIIQQTQEEALQEVRDLTTSLFRDLKQAAGQVIDGASAPRTIRRGEVADLINMSDEELQQKLTNASADNIEDIRQKLNEFQNIYGEGRQEEIDKRAGEKQEKIRNDQLDEKVRAELENNAFNDALEEYGDIAGGTKDLLTTLPKVMTIMETTTSTKSFGEGGKGKEVVSTMGQIAGSAASDAIGTALGPALESALGPLGPIVGEMVGKHLEKCIAEGFEAIGEELDNIIATGQKASQLAINVGFEKIRQDVKTMGSYQLDIYEQATQQLYSAWDKNLAQITATQGYTKDALDALEVSIAERLESEGYDQSINVSQYADLLTSTLSSNLSGVLAEEFAYQSLILQKAIPEFNSSAMTEQFAAIWSRAEYEGSNGKEEMVTAMQQIAGAIRAIEETTSGNNKFISTIPQYLTQAQTIVARAGGSVDQVAELTTQMMAAEGPMAAIAPQLSGFTGELVTLLADQNNATSVALRSIMHDMDEKIGILNTDFMKSFMDNTQDTLETAYRAIGDFIEKNQNPAAEQEFYVAMQDLFGISAEKLSQIDFDYIADQIAATNANLNTASLLDAQALLMDGETATLEEQLVNNTANMVMAQNAIADTIDNNLMRKLEKNELNMERLIYEEMATQSVNLAENTLNFFKKIADVLRNLLDPFGLVRGVAGLINSSVSWDQSADQNEEAYETTRSLSSVGEATEASKAATEANTYGGAQAAIDTGMQGAVTWGTRVSELQKVLDEHGIAGSQGIGSLNSLAALHIATAQEDADKSAKASAQSETLVNDVVVTKSKEDEEAEFQAALDESAKQIYEKAVADEARQAETHDAMMSIQEDTSGINQSSTANNTMLESMVTGISNVATYTETLPQFLTDNITVSTGIQTLIGETKEVISDGRDKLWIMNHLLSKVGDAIDKVWKASEDYWETVPRYLRTTYDEISGRTFKLHKDAYKDLGDAITLIQNSVVSVSDSVKVIKDNLDNSGNSTFSKLNEIYQISKDFFNSNQSNTTDIKSRLDSNNTLLSTTHGSINDLANTYSIKTDSLIAYSSSVAMNTNQTVSTLDKFIQTFEGQLNRIHDDILETHTKIAAVEGEVNAQGKAVVGSLSDVKGAIEGAKTSLDAISANTETVSTFIQTNEQSFNEMHDYLRDINDDTNALTGDGDNSLQKANDYLYNIQQALEEQGIIGSSIKAASDYLKNISEQLWEKFDCKLSEVRDATKNMQININNEYNYVTEGG